MKGTRDAKVVNISNKSCLQEVEPSLREKNVGGRKPRKTDHQSPFISNMGLQD